MMLKPHELHAALGILIQRIEACGGSPELTNAVMLASDIRQAIGNRWNPANEYAAQRVLESTGPVDPADAADAVGKIKEIPPTPAPEAGTVFRNGIDGQCTVRNVWRSRFGDWKVSYHTENGGGGMMSLDHFNETVAIRHAEETPCGPMCSMDDHRRYASRGRCSLCGKSFYPATPNQK